MKFLFNVNMTDKDYFEYNKFILINSSYGKKQKNLSIKYRCVLYIIASLFFLLKFKFSIYSFIAISLFLFMFLLLELFSTPLTLLSLKLHLKNMKKNGKLGYSPSSILEFYDEYFIETTQDNKTEQKYSSIEKISIVENNRIYLHINNVLSYTLPFSCFNNKEEVECFTEFIKSKCNIVEVYNTAANGHIINTNARIRRMLAWAFDWNLSGLPYFIFFSLFYDYLLRPSFENISIIFVAILLAFLCPAIFVFRDLIFGGRSLGKRILGLYIIDKNTKENATVKQRIIRNLFFFIFFIDGIFLICTKESIGDKVANTCIFRN